MMKPLRRRRVTDLDMALTDRNAYARIIADAVVAGVEVHPYYVGQYTAARDIVRARMDAGAGR